LREISSFIRHLIAFYPSRFPQALPAPAGGVNPQIVAFRVFPRMARKSARRDSGQDADQKKTEAEDMDDPLGSGAGPSMSMGGAFS
jgi:hypothetical protein